MCRRLLKSQGLSNICKNAHLFIQCGQYYQPKFCGNLKKSSSVFSKSPPGFNTEQNIPAEWAQLWKKTTQMEVTVIVWELKYSLFD